MLGHLPQHSHGTLAITCRSMGSWDSSFLADNGDNNKKALQEDASEKLLCFPGTQPGWLSSACAQVLIPRIAFTSLTLQT